MPVIRNPFRKTTQIPQIPVNPSSESFTASAHTENTRTDAPGLNNGSPYLNAPEGDSRSTKSASAISIIRGKDEEPGTYKLSVVNDSGVYLPPSPPERKSFWRRNEQKPAPTSDRTALDEPFTISRESFDTYRRSFDISARSPVLAPNRGSLDSQSLPSRASFDSRLSRLAEPPAIIPESKNQDDGFEDVKLNDALGVPKKRGIFSRFGGDGSATADTHANVTGSGFKFSLKKDSGVGPSQESELTRINPRNNQEEIVVG